MAPTIIQTLTLSLDSTSVECQLTGAELVPSYSDTEVRTICETVVTTEETWALEISGLQDWGDAAAITDLLWDAYESGSDVAFELVVASTTFSGTAGPRRTSAGGEAEDPAYDFEVSLPVRGVPSKVTAAGQAQEADPELAAA